MARTTIHELLRASRARLDRLEPEQALAAVHDGAILVDIRTAEQRARDGTIPGAVVHARNVLEWRVDPTSGHSDPRLSRDTNRRIVLVDNEGYQSSLAAAALQDLGFRRATDLTGGFQAWLAAGLPVSAPASARAASPRTPGRPPSDRRSGSRPPAGR
jgi:rhodanese-related sulfurtransferase